MERFEISHIKILRIVYSGYWQRNGYKSNLFALAESGGFGVLISPLLIFIKKVANTTYCGPPFCYVLRYLDISQNKNDEFRCYVDYMKI